MTRTLTGVAIASAAALALVGPRVAPASAQVMTGLPTGGDYFTNDTFAERWYNPGDWYGAPARGSLGPLAAPGAAGYVNPGGLDRAAGERGPSTQASGLSSWGRMPYFGQGYSPYAGSGDSGGIADFYDPARRAAEARARASARVAPGADTAAGTTPAGVGGTDLVPPSAEGGRGVVAENDDLYEDADSLFGGYGDYDYVERGYLPNPSYGYGPRYRGYYSEDWYGDAAAFDDWYDSAPTGDGLSGSSASGTPAPGVTDALDAPGSPPATVGGGAGGLDNTPGARSDSAGRTPGASGGLGTPGRSAPTGGLDAPGSPPPTTGGPAGGLDTTPGALNDPTGGSTTPGTTTAPRP